VNFTYLQIFFYTSLFFGGTAEAMERRTKKAKSLKQEAAKYRELGDALTYAISNRDLEIVRSLLEQGASPNYCTIGGFTPLTRVMTLFSDENEMLEMLLEAGADVNLCVGKENDSPLSFAAYYTKPKMAARLIKAGANLDHVNNSGKTILIDVAEGTRPECMDEAYALGELIVEKMLCIPSENQKRCVYRFMNCLKRSYPMNYSNLRNIFKSVLRAMIREENMSRVLMEIGKIEGDGKMEEGMYDEVRQHLLKRYFNH
jgi:hypothetical protein